MPESMPAKNVSNYIKKSKLLFFVLQQGEVQILEKLERLVMPNFPKLIINALAIVKIFVSRVMNHSQCYCTILQYCLRLWYIYSVNYFIGTIN